jgi:hypothetical protein
MPGGVAVVVVVVGMGGPAVPSGWERDPVLVFMVVGGGWLLMISQGFCEIVSDSGFGVWCFVGKFGCWGPLHRNIWCASLVRMIFRL